MSSFRARCDHHPHVDFPVRADVVDASEDTASHIHTPGNHTVYVDVVDDEPRDVDGFPPAGYVRQLFDELRDLFGPPRDR